MQLKIEDATQSQLQLLPDIEKYQSENTIEDEESLKDFVESLANAPDGLETCKISFTLGELSPILFV